jgi:dynein heavy chain
VFHDRLVDDIDRKWFRESIMELLQVNFRVNWQEEEIFGERNILFSDLLKLDFPEKYYEEIKDVRKLVKVLEDKLDDYNAE